MKRKPRNKGHPELLKEEDNTYFKAKGSTPEQREKHRDEERQRLREKGSKVFTELEQVGLTLGGRFEHRLVGIDKQARDDATRAVHALQDTLKHLPPATPVRMLAVSTIDAIVELFQLEDV